MCDDSEKGDGVASAVGTPFNKCCGRSRLSFEVNGNLGALHTSRTSTEVPAGVQWKVQIGTHDDNTLTDERNKSARLVSNATTQRP